MPEEGIFLQAVLRSVGTFTEHMPRCEECGRREAEAEGREREVKGLRRKNVHLQAQLQASKCLVSRCTG